MAMSSARMRAHKLSLAGAIGAGVLIPGAVAGEVLPTIPTYEMAQTAYALSSANHLESVDQNGIKLPAGASALPAVDQDWFMSWFFSADEMLRHTAATYVLAAKGTTGHSVSGASQTGINIRGGVAGSGIDPFTVGVAATNPALRGFFPDLIRSPAVERGAPHLIVVGQKGRTPFWALIRCGHDGRNDPVVIHSQVGAANDGANSWKYGSNGTTPAYASGAYDFLSGFGGGVDIADGADRRGAGGVVGQFANIWGSFPFVSGAPDPDLLKAIASGTTDPVTLATSVGGTLRYANHMRGPGDLGADTRGVVTAAATEIGLNTNCKPSASAPLRRPPQIRLRAYGDGFVLPMGLNKIGAVPFRGSFQGTAVADSFEARLVRVDNGAVLADWQSIGATIDNTAKTYSGVLINVPAGIAFRREIRWKRRPELIYRDADRLALGVVILDVGQSQLAYQGYASNANDAGSGANLVPSSDANRWMSVIKQANFLNSQAQLTSNWLAALFRPYAAGQHGDGNIATYEQIRRTLGVPVMFVDSATPGTHPNRWLSDRQTFAYSGFGTFSPDGSATQFSFTPVSTALRQNTDTAAAASCVPGSFAMQVGSISITDDGNGNLVGAGITAGTINYQTGAISNLTFSTAPASGVSVSGSFRFFALAPENAVLPQNGGMSMWGDTTQPLDSTYKRGRMMLHLTRLRGIAPSLYRVFWWTAFSGATQAQIAAIFDGLRAKFDATYPVGASVPMGVILPGRENLGAEGTAARLVNPLHRAALAGKAGFAILGDALDFEIAGNTGPHQDPALSRSFGERLGAAVASAHVSDWNANGPVITAAKFTDANRTAIDVTFSLPSGTALTTADGSTTGITGFAVGPAGSAENAWDRTGFTAAIVSATLVRLTKASGSWTAAQRVAFANNVPISTGTSSTKDADNASLLKLLSDNDNAYAGAAKFTSRAGNIARVNPGVIVADA